MLVIDSRDTQRLSRMFSQRVDLRHQLVRRRRSCRLCAAQTKPPGNNRISLVINLEPAVAHEPRPGALDDPASRQHLEATGRDAAHHLPGNPEARARGSEGHFEALITKGPDEAGRFVPRPTHDERSAGVVGRRRRETHHGNEQADRVDNTEVLAARDSLSGVMSPW